MRKRTQDLTGESINCFTVLKLSSNQNTRDEYLWECLCECGEIRYLTTQKVKRNMSCGCKKRIAGGKSNSKLYRVWNSMKQRCSNSNIHEYQWYGGKGVKVCDEWKTSFINFSNWANNNGYKEGLTIERIDSNKNYEPDNCEWITQTENTIRSQIDVAKLYEYDGKIMSITEWSKELGISNKTLYKRLKSGWDIEKVFATKLDISKRNKLSKEY